MNTKDTRSFAQKEEAWREAFNRLRASTHEIFKNSGGLHRPSVAVVSDDDFWLLAGNAPIEWAAYANFDPCDPNGLSILGMRVVRRSQVMDMTGAPLTGGAA